MENLIDREQWKTNEFFLQDFPYERRKKRFAKMLYRKKNIVERVTERLRLTIIQDVSTLSPKCQG